MANHLPAQLDAYLLSFPGAAWDYQPQWQWDRYRIDNHRTAAAGC